MIPNQVSCIVTLLQDNNYEAYLVGGCVRDILMKKQPHDYDIVTNARPDDVIRIAKQNHIKASGVGKSFGVVILSIDEVNYEIASYRLDGKYKDHRRPNEIKYADNVTQDLSRRDFTINAIALDLNNCGMIDPFNGKEDINNHILRCVGNPKDRFINEDYLRMIRLFRFAATLEFTPLQPELSIISEYKGRLKYVAKERIQLELDKILSAKKPSIAFNLMKATGALSILFPELDILKVIPQGNPHNDSVWDHTMKVIDNAAMFGADRITMLAALFHDAGKARAITFEEKIRFREHSEESCKIAFRIMKKYRYSNEDIKLVLELIHRHMTMHHIKDEKPIIKYVNSIGIEQVMRLTILHIADSFDQRFSKNELNKIELVEKAINISPKFILAINGNDIMSKLNIPSGKTVGRIKQKLENDVVDGLIANERKPLLEYIDELELE